jgi:hypothetical protein
MRTSNRTKALIALGLTPLMFVLPAQGAVRDKDKTKARVAAYYLTSQQADDGSIVAFSPLGSTSDAIVALVAARRGKYAIKHALGYLHDHEVEIDTVGERAKVIQALVAAGRSPHSFEGRDLVQEIQDQEQPGGRYGAETQVFDHANAMIALRAAGEIPSVAATKWLARAQCEDGGWQFDQPSSQQDDAHCSTGAGDDFTTSDTNTTSLASQALPLGAGNFNLKKSPFRFFRRARDPIKHGWGYTKGFVTDTNSTALVIQAYVAAGKALPKNSKDALRHLQYPLCKQHGAFPFNWQDDDHDGKYGRSGPDVGGTIQGILGLLERPYPVPHREVTRSAKVSFSAC